ncbi:T9SS type A sorting domain-containing protein [Bernardetia sp. ABR2-2B]|uniref:T9SS type A sorting domain-containing protein n=1 Tax=Bernardetia sp. ABR2-2B TaxID=3127472 RepID=UPI0030D4C692
MKQIFTVFWVLVFCCCFSASSFGQVFTDVLAISDSEYSDLEGITDIKIDKDNNTIISGYAFKDTLYIGGNATPLEKIGNNASSSLEKAFFYVTKLSPTNEVIWVKNGEIYTESLYNSRSDLKIDNNGNIYVSFSTSPSSTNQNQAVLLNWANDQYDSVDNFILKLSTNGDEIWHKGLLLGNYHIIGFSTTEIEVDNDENLFLALNTYRRTHNIDENAFIFGNDSSQTGVLILKFDSNANYLWNRQIVGTSNSRNSNSDVYLSDFIIDDEGRPILSVTGYTTLKEIVYVGTSESDNAYDGDFLVKYDNNGNLLYRNSVSKDCPFRGTVFIGGLSKKSIVQAGSNTYVSGAKCVNQFTQEGVTYVVKMDENLNTTWEYSFPVDCKVNGILVDKNKNIYLNVELTDRTLTSVQFGTTFHELEGENLKFFLVKLNEEYGVDWGLNLENSSLLGEQNIKVQPFDIDNEGYIYINGDYSANSIIGTTQMPNYGGEYIAKIKDYGFTLPDLRFRGKGKAFSDTNNDCEFNNSEQGIPNILIKRNDGYYAISNDNGDYLMPFPNGNYTLQSSIVKIDTSLPQYFIASCDTIKQVIIEDREIQDSTSLNFGYKVKPCAYLSIDITNQRRRRCFMSSTTVEYQNKGFATAQNVEVKVEYPDYIFPVSSSPAWTRKEGNNYFFNVGRLAAGNIEKIVFQDSVICGIEEIRGLTQCVKATISPANSCEEWTDNENKYEISGRCVGGGVARYTIQNLTNISTDSIPYRLYANSQVFKEANTLLPANGEVEIEVFTNGATMRMELFPQNHDPISAFAEGCQVAIPYKTKAENPNPVLSVAPVQESGVALPQNDGGERSETSCSEILDSYDPNDKQVVPFGLTNQNLIEKTTELDYTIRFQNTGTIEAVNIVVLDTLSEFLDIETIRLGMVSHGYNFIIDGDADTRVLRFQFDNINLPDSNSNEPESHGFIKFKIKQKENNRIGTVIKNRAAIYFDFNSPIITNTISNKVAILPLTNSNLNLPVFNCSDSNFELVADAGADIETPNSTANLAAQNIGITGNWTLLSGFGELTDASKNNSKVTELLPFPTKLVWRVAACGEAKQDTVTVLSTNSDYKFEIDFNQEEGKLSVPTGKVTYQWYRDGVLITGQTDPTLDLTALDNRMGVYTVVISSGDTSVTSEPFTIDRILSNDDFIKKNYIKVYPNPTTSLLNVELNTILNTSEVTLVNALGMELQKTKITNSNKITLDLNKLSNGIYFVKIVSQKGIFYKKVVLKK